MPGLRLRLRHDTRDVHDEVEGLFGLLDLSRRDDLTFLLQTHEVALRCCLEAVPPDQESDRRCLEALLAAIARDLYALGATPARVDLAGHTQNPDIHPLGLIYVIAGSRLGAKVLLAQPRGSENATVRRATAYLSCAEGLVLWRRTLSLLEAWEGSAAEEEEIVSAARTGFAWFGDAYADVQRTKTRNDPHSRVA